DHRPRRRSCARVAVVLWIAGEPAHTLRGGGLRRAISLADAQTAPSHWRDRPARVTAWPGGPGGGSREKVLGVRAARDRGVLRARWHRPRQSPADESQH